MLRASRLWLIVTLAALVSIALSLSVNRLAVAAALLTATPTTKSNASAGLIAFESTRTGNSEIYVMRPDGSGLSQLTNNPASDRFPAWSPDGKRILFSSDRDGRRDLYVMNANGTGVKRLTMTASADEIAPTWSPDGKKIAFFVQMYDSMSDTDSPPDLYTMNADGSAPTLLFDSTQDNLKLNAFLSWSPDGKKIAFAALKDNKAAIFTADADGRNITQLTTTEGNDLSPAWSPDGKKIAFMSAREANGSGTIKIFVINSDGSNEQVLTPDAAFAASPAWSPDGTKLVFTVLEIQDAAIKAGNLFIMDADGSNQSQLMQVQDQYIDDSAAWSPTTVSLKLPLPTFIPQPTPKGSSVDCPIATDKTYGYNQNNPINVGGGDFGGPENEDKYLAQLRGPKGEEITSNRTGSFPRESDGVILDIYVITYPGHSQPITLYVNEYSNMPPLIPVGFSCAPAN